MMPLSSSFMDAVPLFSHSVATTCFLWSSFPLCYWTHNTLMQLLYYFLVVKHSVFCLFNYTMSSLKAISRTAPNIRCTPSYEIVMCVEPIRLYFPYWSYIFDITLAFIQGHKNRTIWKHFNMSYKLPKALFIIFNVLLHKSHKPLKI